MTCPNTLPLLLDVRNLTVTFSNEDRQLPLVHGVDFSIGEREIVGLVGESGSGKSLTCLSIIGLLQRNLTVDGSVRYRGRELLDLDDEERARIRGREITMIFQDPMSALNPVRTVASQIVEGLKINEEQPADRVALRKRATRIMQQVGIPDPETYLKCYPHELSGGLNQRVMIAMMLAGDPRLLIADEPTTALDVTIQAQILDLLDELQEQNGMSILLITHNLAVVGERAADVAVMYASRIVEIADSQGLFEEPLHPYTQGLLKSLPRLGLSVKRLETIRGTVPEPLHFPAGCKFHPRCPIGCGDGRCQTLEPRLREVRAGRRVACWHAPGYEKKCKA